MSPQRYGVRVECPTEHGWIPVDHPETLGVTTASLVALPEQEIGWYLDALRGRGIAPWLLLVGESFRGRPWAETMREYRDKYADKVEGWVIGNEPDLVSPSSWTMAQREFSRLLWTARDALPDALLYAGGLASGHPGWLLEGGGVELQWVDGVTVHTYGKSPDHFLLPDWYDEYASVKLREYRATLLAMGIDKPLTVGEFGAPVKDFKGDANEHGTYYGLMAETFRGMWAVEPWLADVFAFCYSNRMVPGFGLCDEALNPLPAWSRYRDTIQGIR
jgi:hypothetical protein